MAEQALGPQCLLLERGLPRPDPIQLSALDRVLGHLPRRGLPEHARIWLAEELLTGPFQNPRDGLKELFVPLAADELEDPLPIHCRRRGVAELFMGQGAVIEDDRSRFLPHLS